RDALVTSLAEKDEQLAKLAGHVESTTTKLVGMIEDLSKRLESYANEPAPAKTAGTFAVSKEEDASGAAALEKVAPTEEDIQKALAEMPADERALLLTKAALRMPRQAHFVPAR